MYNIIGDVHGEYKTLMALLKKMPDYQPLFLGDMIDRGPDSKKVLDFAMKHGKAVLGNHEHMMIDAYRKGGYYQNSLWVMCNGGIDTLWSFSGKNKRDCFVAAVLLEKDLELDFRVNDIPEKYVEWCETLPLVIQEKDLIISHAPLHPQLDLESAKDLGRSASDPECKDSIIWNIKPAAPQPLYRQIHGHYRLKKVEFKEDWTVLNLDTVPHRMTGYSWPDNKIYTQEIIKED